MKTSINNLEDVSSYARHLTSLSLNFHPDDDFENYVNNVTGAKVFNSEQAAHHNALMDQCFTICRENGIDIHNFMLDIVLVETGMDKLVPRP